MFVYEKKLQYPVKIKNCNPKLAAVIISQYGGAYSNSLLPTTPPSDSKLPQPHPGTEGVLCPTWTHYHGHSVFQP